MIQSTTTRRAGGRMAEHHASNSSFSIPGIHVDNCGKDAILSSMLLNMDDASASSSRLPIGVKIKILNNFFDQQLNREVADLGLSSSQAQVIGFLKQREGSIVHQRDIESEFNFTHPTVTGIVKRLSAKGFVTCMDDPMDRRYKQVQLTEKTRHMHEKMQKHINKISLMVFSGLNDKEIVTMDRLLGKMVANLK
jgi:MarR family transcriptional regulator, repressor for mepA